MNYGPASKYYDLFASQEDIPFYRELAVKHGKKALELGVGTGRVAIALAKAGVDVWGIDNSKHMLNVARQKLNKESLYVKRHVTLKLGDMRDFELEKNFPFVYIASSTFEHCISEEDQKKCLASAYRSLKKKGTFAFDISQLTRKKSESSWWIDRKQVSEKEEVVRTIFSRRNPQNNVVSVNLFFDVYQNGTLTERYYEYGEARIHLKKDVEKLLENAGFVIDNIYGAFDKSAYDERSQRAIFVSSKQ